VLLEYQIWDDIHAGRIEEDCTLLSRFLLISFADLKKWRFYYSVAFPALVPDPPATLVYLKPASEFFSLKEVLNVKTLNFLWAFNVVCLF